MIVAPIVKPTVAPTVTPAGWLELTIASLNETAQAALPAELRAARRERAAREQAGLVL